MDTLVSLFPLLLIAAVFYLLILRPQRNRAKEAKRIREAVDVGAEVMTTAGLFGTVVEVEDDTIYLEVAPGVVTRYLKAAIARVIEDGETDEEIDEAVDDEFSDEELVDDEFADDEVADDEVADDEVDARARKGGSSLD